MVLTFVVFGLGFIAVEIDEKVPDKTVVVIGTGLALEKDTNDDMMEYLNNTCLYFKIFKYFHKII